MNKIVKAISILIIGFAALVVVSQLRERTTDLVWGSILSMSFLGIIIVTLAVFLDTLHKPKS